MASEEEQFILNELKRLGAGSEEEFILAELSKSGATPTDYSLGQLAFDVPVGVTKAAAGLGDLLMQASPQAIGNRLAAQLMGQPEPETPTLTGLVEQGAEYVAPMLGVRPKTEAQRAVEFMTPLPGGGKLRLAKDVGLGALAYGGEKIGQYIAPDSQYSGLLGALAAPIAAKGTMAVIREPMERTGAALQRSARGVRATEYQQSAKAGVIENIEGNYKTRLKAALDRLNKNNILGTSLEPNVTYAKLETAKQTTENAIQTALKTVEDKKGAIPIPTFAATKEYVKNRVAADQVEKYLDQIDTYKRALEEKGAGRLTYLNQQKKVIGENWKNRPESDPGFYRSLYNDMKQHIEKYAPEVKELNKNKQDLLIVEPIVKRNLAASDKGITMEDVRRGLFYTTGGLGIPGAYYMLGPSGAVLAAALGAAATPKGQQLIGRGLQAASQNTAPGISLANVLLSGAKAANNEQGPMTPIETSVPNNALDDEIMLIEQLLAEQGGEQ